MKEKLRDALNVALARLRPAFAFLRAHRLVAECAVVTLLGVLAAFSFGYSALRRTAALEARAADLARVGESFDRWEAELQPPTPQESASWRESDASLRSIGGRATRPLTIARLVAQRAEEVGISGLTIQLLNPDSIAPPAPVQLAGWTIQTEGEGLVVEFDGNVGDVVGLLGALPPQAAVTNLEIAPRDGALHARVVMLTRQLVAGE